MKRTVEEDHNFDRFPRRQCTTNGYPLKSRYRQPGDLLLTANPQDPAVLDSLIGRSLAVALHSAGFTAVQKDALESLRGLLDAYLKHLTLLVHRAMISSRRRKPLPNDFHVALRTASIPFDPLLSDIRPQKPERLPRLSSIRRTTQPPLFPRAPSTSTAKDFDFSNSAQLAITLGAESDKASRKYIPTNFPSFPPPHTYRATEMPLADRENDARKIRERATEEGVLAERALRKLVQAKKITREGASRPVSRQGRAGAVGGDFLFKAAMQSVLQDDAEVGRESLQLEDEMLFFGDSGEGRRRIEEDQKRESAGQTADSDFGTFVNHEQAHWRSEARDTFSLA